MLKGISPAVSPDLLKVLAEMGHGDEGVIPLFELDRPYRRNPQVRQHHLEEGRHTGLLTLLKAL